MGDRSLRVLAGVSDPGGAHCLLPVLAALARRGHQVTVCARPPAARLAPSLAPAVHVIPRHRVAQAFRRATPDVVVSSVCTDRRLRQMLTREAARRGTPVVWVQDFWGTGLAEADVQLPSKVVVPDALGARLVRARWGRAAAGRIAVAPPPAFEGLAAPPSSREVVALRRRYGLSDGAPVLLFAGEAWGTPSMLRMLAEALAWLVRRVTVVVKLHPRASAHSRERSRALLDALPAATVREMDGMPAEALVRAADVVVSGMSTVLLTAVYLRRTVISLATRITRTKLARLGLRRFPPVDAGACAEARNARELAVLLDDAVSGDLGPAQRRAQARAFPAVRHGAARIAWLVERAANGGGR